MNELNNEDHPEWYYDIPNMETLILGSFPPHHTKWHYPFYYPNSINLFWKILSNISNVHLTPFSKKDKDKYESIALKERYLIMEKLKIGVQNMGKKIKRKGKSANDNDIIIEEYQDILSIIKAHQSLKQILLPGFHAKYSTYRSFIDYLKSKNIEVLNETIKPNSKLTFEIKVDNKTIDCFVLNSTSTAARIKYEDIFKQFNHHLIK